jgi:hypothetical protein
VVTNLRVYYFYTQGCGRDRRSGIPCALDRGTLFYDHPGIWRRGNAELRLPPASRMW